MIMLRAILEPEPESNNKLTSAGQGVGGAWLARLGLKYAFRLLNYDIH